MPFKILVLLLATSYFIYIPIMYFKSSLFLFFQDIILFYALIITVFSKNKLNSVFGGSYFILFLILIYFFSLSIRFFLDFSQIDLKMITVTRNLSFGIGIFVVSSIWIVNQIAVDFFIRISIVLTYIVSINGYRQLFFGFAPFELERLSIMGSSLKEMDQLDRFRITSSFGDPMVFSFFMMAGIFFYFLARKRNIVPIITHKLHPYSLMFILFSLISTLTRAPLLGLLIGMCTFILLKFKLTFKNLFKFISVISTILLFVYSINFIVSNKYLSNIDNPFIKNVNNGIESLWSVINIVKDVDKDSDEYFLIGQSKNSRSNSWKEGISYLILNPFGAGLINKDNFNFSIGDVGILSIGLQIGIFGFFSVIALYFFIGFKSWLFIKNCKLEQKDFGYILISFWVSICISGGISSILDSSVINIIIWSVAGILVNQKKLVNTF